MITFIKDKKLDLQSVWQDYQIDLGIYRKALDLGYRTIKELETLKEYPATNTPQPILSGIVGYSQQK